MVNDNGKNGKGVNGSGKNGNKGMFLGRKLPQFKGMVAAPVGRPPVPINWEIVRRLAMIHCTPAEIAAVMGLEEASLVTRKEFPKTYRVGWEAGKMSLRRMQFLRARDGNVQMLVFLGKNILHQRDYWTGELTGKDGGAIEIADATRPRLERLSLEELKQLETLVSKATPEQIAASGDTVDAEVV